MIALRVEDLKVHFGGVHAVDGIDLEMQRGGVHALIGPNGAGKTTLINAVTGVSRPTSGRVHLGGREVTGLPAHKLARLGVTRTFQNLQIFWTMSVLDNVLAGFHLASSSGFFSSLVRAPRLVRGEKELTIKATDLLRRVGLGDRADHSAGALAYGELKRLEIARALATSPSLLFLDEPVAGCTQTEKKVLGDVIRRIADDTGATIVLVEHDMGLVMSISDTVTVLAQGRVLARGRPAEVRNDRKVIEAYLGASQNRAVEPEHAAAR